MSQPTHSPALLETLRDAQRLGFFGSRPIDEAVTHSDHFVAALGDVASDGSVLDLGSGGGLPGLVLGEAFPSARIVLLDRRQRRTDFLDRAVRRLQWGHVDVVHADADDLAREVESGRVPAFDAVTARGFGPPEVTLGLAVRCCRPGGSIVISEPPDRDRWPRELLDGLGVEIAERGTVIRFVRR